MTPGRFLTAGPFWQPLAQSSLCFKKDDSARASSYKSTGVCTAFRWRRRASSFFLSRSETSKVMFDCHVSQKHKSQDILVYADVCKIACFQKMHSATYI